jgi:glycine/D-amino acid oxidase-like deaminating enzyme
MNVAVVGAGALGATAAHDLAVRGVDVEVFERGAAPDGATPRAAGVVYDAFAEDVDARVADRATERFREFSGSQGFELVECPYVWLAREGDDRRASAIQRQIERMTANGRRVSLLSTGELRDRFPEIHADDVAVAAVAENAGYCDTHSYAHAVLTTAERAGATVNVDAPVSVATDPPRVAGFPAPERREYDAVLVAAGAHSPELLADAGIAIPVKPYRAQALTAAAPDYDAPMVYDATAGFYCRPHPRGLLAGDGTVEREADPDDYDRDADGWFREETTANLAHRLDRDLEPERDVRRAWAGLCTATPDRDPLVGAVADGLYVATGFQGHGFMRSPALGAAIAEAILEADAAPIEAFDPDRFDGDEEFEVVEGMTIDD